MLLVDLVKSTTQAFAVWSLPNDGAPLGRVSASVSLPRLADEPCGSDLLRLVASTCTAIIHASAWSTHRISVCVTNRPPGARYRRYGK